MKLLDTINSKLEDTKPTTIILGTAAACFTASVIYKILNHPKGIKHAIMSGLYSALTKIPGAEEKIAKETQAIAEQLAATIPAIKDDFHYELPEKGFSYEELVKRMENLAEQQSKLVDRISGGVYFSNFKPKHTELIAKAYEIFIHANPLHTFNFPAIRKMEAEILNMSANLLGDKNAVGAMTSGGTESILMAIKTYRDWAKATKGIVDPELVIPVTAHAAFDKACHYFGIKCIFVPVDQKTFTVDPKLMEKQITRNTIAIVGSAPNFPHGTIDPIPELAKLALKYKIGMHVDCCLGGFFLPFAKRIRPKGFYPDFDFSVPGVTSISADTHKYGFASKGSSVVLFKTKELRRYMYFVSTDWPGGVYASPTIAGSRPGALVACCWSAMMHMGMDGYLKSTKEILETVDFVRKGVEEIKGLKLMGASNAMIVACTSSDPELNIFKVQEAVKAKGWDWNTILYPSGIHLCVTQHHIGKGKVIVDALKAAVDDVRKNPDKYTDQAKIYGQVVGLPDKTPVREFVTRFFDKLLTDVDLHKK